MPYREPMKKKRIYNLTTRDLRDAILQYIGNHEEVEIDEEVAENTEITIDTRSMSEVREYSYAMPVNNPEYGSPDCVTVDLGWVTVEE